MGLKLPLGIMPTDIEDGFPTARRYVSLAGWRAAGMPDRDIRCVEEEDAGTMTRIRMGNAASGSFVMYEGLDQGRRRNPPGYIGVVQKLASAVEESGPALGLDPPSAAVAAAKGAGVDPGDDEPDLGEARVATAACQAVMQAGGESGAPGSLSEEEVAAGLRGIMERIGNGATRLAVLDMLSATTVGMLQIIDDGCIFRSSPALLKRAGESVGER